MTWATARLCVFSIQIRTVVTSPAAFDQSLFEREGSDAREEVAAVLVVRDLGAIGPDLQEQIVHVGVVATAKA